MVDGFVLEGRLGHGELDGRLGDAGRRGRGLDVLDRDAGVVQVDEAVGGRDVVVDELVGELDGRVRVELEPADAVHGLLVGHLRDSLGHVELAGDGHVGGVAVELEAGVSRQELAEAVDDLGCGAVEVADVGREGVDRGLEGVVAVLGEAEAARGVLASLAEHRDEGFLEALDALGPDGEHGFAERRLLRLGECRGELFVALELGIHDGVEPGEVGGVDLAVDLLGADALDQGVVAVELEGDVRAVEFHISH